MKVIITNKIIHPKKEKECLPVPSGLRYRLQ